MAWWTTRAQGDQRAAGSAALRGALPPGTRVVALRQVHGPDVVVVDGSVVSVSGPGERSGDALVSTDWDVALMVRTADCAAVALGSPEGVFAAVHAGWRGLLQGVVEASLGAAGALGASQMVAGLGPCIGPCCYPFEGPVLDELAERYGPEVRGKTRQGEPALDLPAALRSALARAGVTLVTGSAPCTGCEADTWSHRVRGDEARQALVVWRAEAS